MPAASRRSHVRVTLLSLGLAVALLTPLTLPRQAVAQDQVAVVQRLGDPDFAVRLRATAELLQDDTLTPERCVLLYSRAGNEEARRRVLLVAQHHLLRHLRLENFPVGDRGSIGVNLVGVPADQAPQLQQPAVRVVNTYAGFPGYAWLQVGDLIVAVDGKPLPAAGDPRSIADQFIAMVTARAAGDVLHLRVWRQGEFFEARFPLANFDAIRGMNDPFGVGLKPPYVNQWLDLRRRMTEQTPAPAPLRVTDPVPAPAPAPTPAPSSAPTPENP